MVSIHCPPMGSAPGGYGHNPVGSQVVRDQFRCAASDPDHPVASGQCPPGRPVRSSLGSTGLGRQHLYYPDDRGWRRRLRALPGSCRLHGLTPRSPPRELWAAPSGASSAILASRSRAWTGSTPIPGQPQTARSSRYPGRLGPQLAALRHPRLRGLRTPRGIGAGAINSPSGGSDQVSSSSTAS